MTRLRQELDPDRLLRSGLRPARGRLAVAVVAFIVKDSPLWILPIVTATVIDALVEQRDPSSLVAPAGLAVVAILANVLANAVYVRAYSYAVRQLGARLREALATRLQELSIGYHARSSAAVAQTKVVRDVENIELMLQQSFGPVLSAFTILIGAGIATALRVPEFLPVFALTVPLATGLILWLRRRTGPSNEAFRRSVEQMSSRVNEMSSLLEVTRAHGLEAVSVRRVVDTSNDVQRAGMSLDRLNGRFGALSWSSYQLLTLGCLFGAALVSMSGLIPISVGDVVLLSSYFSLLTGSISSAFQIAPIVTKGIESRRSIVEVLLEPDVERNGGKREVSAARGAIDFVGVDFDYGSGRVIDGLDLSIAPGETVAFVGPSGSGKSTLVNLALGFLRPVDGRVLIDGADIESIDMRTARRFISVVPQESVLFRGSIRENVAYGIEDVSDELLTDALLNANADFVFDLPDGWDTPVGDRGAQLSGGQRQRLAIARALIRDPAILILDEATAALDPETQAEVQDAIDRLTADRTTLVVAHRLSTVRRADRIVVLEAGSIVESGSHDELAAAGGTYARLLAQQ
ncbi:ATP-binding cassette subfamily B protein [Agromyces terreus]|uniref:ATP-binding cassette subfamily B protein n=1 Tax=Agromyces terreus TaxID=424795 RepID=A0A9X2H3V4_9MICO|nr:ABC transporter ATP-binding protein [Agromyces terreus]MCP2370322.1 ATP-binding cassette subfamily B protein [Agromyces terreus]